MDADRLVNYRDGLLPSDAQPAFFRFVGQGRLVDRLQQSRTGTGMHPKDRIDDLLSHGILAHCDPVWISRQVAKNNRQEEDRRCTYVQDLLGIPAKPTPPGGHAGGWGA